MVLFVCSYIQHLGSSSTHNQPINDDTRLAAQLQLQVRALDIIMLLWRANADPLKPAKLDDKDILPVDVTHSHNVVALLLSKLFYIPNCQKVMVFETAAVSHYMTG